ncbi:hypothetical protein KFE25_010680 [Diacronema lutheri]|uniref:Uncharacterized protein n=1 Tax=Diacronema lutheri TaxID=2081491 RepID=A0A8J6C5B7_DIALT|nr:hypothetical protein KFE25_010680 [Diacronema lutheri]
MHAEGARLYRARRRRAAIYAACARVIHSAAAAALVFVTDNVPTTPADRAKPRPRDRSKVMRDIAHDLTDAEFKRCYRMDKATFQHLLECIRPHVAVRDSRRGDGLDLDLMLSMALSWLRGGSDLDIGRLHKVGRPCARGAPRAPAARSSTFYHVLWVVIAALNKGLDREMDFPFRDRAALADLERRFAERWGKEARFLYRGLRLELLLEHFDAEQLVHDHRDCILLRTFMNVCSRRRPFMNVCSRRRPSRRCK